MSFTQYIKDLLPSFESAKLRDNIANLASELDSELVPAFGGMKDALPGTYKFQHPEAIKLNEKIVKGYRGPIKLRNANSLELIHQVMVNMQTTLPLIEQEIDKAFDRQVAAVGLTFSKANILQYAEVADFFMTYAQTYYNYVSAAELALLDGNRQVIEGIGPNDFEFLRAKAVIFAIAMNIMAVEVKKLKQELAEIPDMTIDAATEADLRVVVGGGRLDPMGFASLPFPLSVPYRIGLMLVDSQVSRYERARQQARVLEYRTIQLKERLERGQGDAATERRLRIEEDELNRVKREIERMEKKYGAGNV